MMRYMLAILLFICCVPGTVLIGGAHADDGPAAASHDAKESGDGHHHDTTDLGHANGTPMLTNPTEIRFDLAMATFLVFVLLLLLLGKFAWGPIASALDQRERQIADMIATAETNAKASEARLRELEKRLAEQAEAVRVAINEARREGELQKEQILAEAQAAAQRERDLAVADIRDAKNLALRDLARHSVNTAVNLAKNIIRREVNPADHEKMISETLAQFHNQN